MRRKLTVLLMVMVLLATGLWGCGGHNDADDTTENAGALQTSGENADPNDDTDADGFVISNAILGETYDFEYTAVPQRVVTLASPATEMLLALGLEDHIVGYAMQENEIPAKYKEAFDSLHCITEDWTVSKEMIMALEPDFMMFWNGSPDYDYQFLVDNQISTYTLTSDIDGAKIEWLYDDFTNMGKIFDKEERAAQIIAEMKAKIDPVAEKMKDVEPVSVVYIDAYSSEEAAFTAGDALVADIFRKAGGENVVNDTTDPWLNISWEQVAAANPEWIVIGVYEGAEDADYWINFLKTNPATKEIDAVKNEHFIVTGLVDLTVGERVADTVPMLASYFHPDK